MIEEFRARRTLVIDGLNAIPGRHVLQPAGRVLRVPAGGRAGTHLGPARRPAARRGRCRDAAGHGIRRRGRGLPAPVVRQLAGQPARGPRAHRGLPGQAARAPDRRRRRGRRRRRSRRRRSLRAPQSRAREPAGSARHVACNDRERSRAPEPYAPARSTAMRLMASLPGSPPSASRCTSRPRLTRLRFARCRRVPACDSTRSSPARRATGTAAALFSSRDDEWIEIVNTGAGAVDLAGFFVTDGDSIPRYAFSGTLGARRGAARHRQDELRLGEGERPAGVRALARQHRRLRDPVGR